MVADKSLLVCTGLLALIVAGLALGGDRSSALPVDATPDLEDPAPPAAEASYAAAPRSQGSSESRRAPGRLEVDPDCLPAPVASGPRELLVAVRDRQGLPLPDVELAVEVLGDSGVWSLARVGRADENGEARFSGLWERTSYRVGATFPSAPAPVEVPAQAPAPNVVHLTLERPAPALVELRSANGYALSGARRVEFHAQGPRGRSVRALSPASGRARWALAVVERAEGVLYVTDSLGRTWRAPIALAPGETSSATPGPAWIAIARADLPGAPAAPRVERERLRWSLRLGDRSPQRGSGWLASDGGFHAVVASDAARALGGHLELRWNAPEGERELLCWWHPDPDLEHVELQPSPVGEVVSLSTSNFGRQ